MKTRVLLAASSFQGGGAEHVARGNLRGLCSDPRYEAAVITCRPETVPPLWGVRVYPARDFRQSDSFLARARDTMGIEENAASLRRCFEEFSPQIVHLHDYLPFTPSFLHALSACRRRYGCRVVLTHHTYSYLCTNDMLYSFPKEETCEQCLGSYDGRILQRNCADNMTISAAKFLQKNLLRDSLRACIDLHIAPSGFLRGLLLRAFPALDVRLIHNPCLQRVNSAPPAEKTQDVLYFGRISREKGLHFAAEHFLFREPGRRLLIIGDGPQAAKLSRLLQGQERVRLLRRFLPTEELLPRVAAARFFLLPSAWYENSPVSIVEAVNAYTVPVVSDLGGMKELCGLLGVGHTFEAGNPESLHRALEEALLSFDRDQQAMRESRGRLQTFTEAAYWQAIERIYRSL